MKRRKVKLSEMKRLIDSYIELHGDAEVSSISTHCGNEAHIEYTLNLCDLTKDDYRNIGGIEIKYEEC